jgi:hypothetical protein
MLEHGTVLVDGNRIKLYAISSFRLLCIRNIYTLPVMLKCDFKYLNNSSSTDKLKPGFDL